MLQKCEEDGDESSISSSEGTNHFQMDLDLLEEQNPKIVLALKSSKNVDLDLRNVLLLDNQSTFDLCCNKKFTSQVTKATNALGVVFSPHTSHLAALLSFTTLQK